MNNPTIMSCIDTEIFHEIWYHAMQDYEDITYVNFDRIDFFCENVPRDDNTDDTDEKVKLEMAEWEWRGFVTHGWYRFEIVDKEIILEPILLY